MQINKNITKSFNSSPSPFDIVKSMMEKGVNGANDLSRMTGIGISQFIKLNVDVLEKSLTSNIVGVPLGSNEFHFYEMIGGLITNGVIEKSLIIAEEDFAETLINSNTSDYSKKGNEIFTSKFKMTIQKSLSNEVNIEKDTLVLFPGIGGYFGQKTNLIKSLNDLSINQLDLLYKGISRRNPNYSLLSKIVEEIQSKNK